MRKDGIVPGNCHCLFQNRLQLTSLKHTNSIDVQQAKKRLDIPPGTSRRFFKTT